MRKLDETAKTTIRHALAGLRGPTLKREAERLAAHYAVSSSQVYAVSAPVRQTRKRSDRGRRAADLLENPGLASVAEAVVTANLDIIQAIRFAEVNGHTVPVSAGTTARYLREHGISARQLKRKSAATPHRRFEAQYPGQCIQMDWSTVKEQWVDVETRRTLRVSVLDVSENHPNTKANRVKLWKAVAVDDYSRRCWVRFYACLHPTSLETLDFLDLVIREGGVPERLYTDRDGLFGCQHVRRFFELLNQDGPGFVLEQHSAGNSRATGKVENKHQQVARRERLIGLLDKAPTIDELNDFALRIEEELNWTRHRTTGEIPALRWRRDIRPMRVPAAECSAMLRAKEFAGCLINGDLTVTVKGQGQFQLPRRQPFVDWISQKVTIVWPEGVFFWLVGPDGKGYRIDRCAPIVNQLGEYNAPGETRGQKTAKAVKAKAAESRDVRKTTGEQRRVPLFHTESPTRPTILPKPVEEFIPPVVLSPPAVIPDSIQVLPLPQTNWLSFFQAVELLQHEERFGVPPSPDEIGWLREGFAGRERIDETELRRALAARTTPNVAKLRRA